MFSDGKDLLAEIEKELMKLRPVVPERMLSDHPNEIEQEASALDLFCLVADYEVRVEKLLEELHDDIRMEDSK